MRGLETGLIHLPKIRKNAAIWQHFMGNTSMSQLKCEAHHTNTVHTYTQHKNNRNDFSINNIF